MGVEAMETVMRRCAETVARFIESDEVLGSYDGLAVIVEDKAEIESAIKAATTRATGGVAVLVAVTGFRRRQNSGRILTGTLGFQISVHENPLFNRKGQFVLTAQCAAERIAAILHWTKLDGFDNRMTVDDMRRADDNSANIVVVRAAAEQSIKGTIQ